jgi:hypothetical protein
LAVVVKLRATTTTTTTDVAVVGDGAVHTKRNGVTSSLGAVARATSAIAALPHDETIVHQGNSTRE